MIRILLAFLAGVAMTLVLITAEARSASPTSPDSKVAGDLDAASCTEDEVPIRYPDGVIVCLHIEGDGWRVG